MKIKDNRRLCEDFGSLKLGDVFSIEDGGSFYIKIEQTYENDLGDYENAVNLLDGTIYFFDDDRIVYPVNCELLIE